MSLGHGLLWSLTAVALLFGLFLLLFGRLRRSEFKQSEAAGLALLALAQPAYAGPEVVHSAIIALAAYAVATAAEAFVQRQDPRRIVVLGGSLAGAQLASPVWGTITMLVLPLALRRTLPAADAARLVGLYLSLLFIPLLMSLSFLAMSGGAWIAIPSWPPPRAVFSVHNVALPCAMLIVASPLALAVKLGPSIRGQIAGVICAVIAVTGSVSWLLTVGSPVVLVQCGAAVGVLTILAISGWPPEASRPHKGASVLCASTAVCWAMALTVTARHV